ncbi:MAG: peptidase C45 [Acidobacteria bacterium]|nr:peptidase C45 [Acidobacteriota bacterium]
MKPFRAILALALAASCLLGASARQEKKGWIQVQLSGTPREMGLQHGRILSAEIADGLKAIQTIIQHDTKKDWGFYRKAGKEILWPKVEQQYREELEGIAEGLKEKGSKLDLWDVVALNGWMELAWYYVPVYNQKHGIPTPSTVTAPEHCSAFIATGAYTSNGKIVVAHNAWVDFAIGQRWNIVFDVRPAQGMRMIMDGYPGLIHSGDDFGINTSGIVITETTISAFQGFDEKGIPEFVRARKALQYGKSIDEVTAIFKEGNNGGYANAWLIGDNKTNEIARLELGLKNVTLERTRNGYFAGSNFPINPKLIAEEASGFDPKDLSTSPTARRVRWESILEKNKGKIDLKMAQRFMGDDVDSFENKQQPNERTLCGRLDLSPRGSAGWQPPYGPCGAVQNKAADASMIDKMMLSAAYGPQCGPDFKVDDFFKAHPEFLYQKGVLKDMPRQPWVDFKAAQ